MHMKCIARSKNIISCDFSNSAAACSPPIYNLGPGNLDLHCTSQAAILRRRCQSLPPNATVYRDATKDFNRFHRTNLCKVSPIHLEAQSFTRTTLLAEAFKREKLLTFTVSPERSSSYHRPHCSDGLIKRLLQPGGLRSRIHLVVSGGVSYDLL